MKRQTYARARSLGLALVALGMAVMVVGHSWGLFIAPREAMMGDVGRILYVHVPTAWGALLFYLVGFVAAIGSLWTGRRFFDASTTAWVEVGTLMTMLLLIQGSIWARPTWGTWWTWDPRLTTSAVLAMSFGVVLLLRRLIDQAGRRSMATAVSTIVATVNVPIVYKSVEWWNSLHQPMSSRDSIDSPMWMPLMLTAVGVTLLGTGLATLRTLIELSRLLAEEAAPELPELPGRLSLNAPEESP